MKIAKKFKSPTKTLIVFWGNFGGGVRLSKNLLSLATEQSLDVRFSISINSEGWDESYRNSRLTSDFLVETPRKKLKTMNIVSGFMQSFRIFRKIRNHGINQVVMLMPHPWDFILECLAHFGGIKVMRCMHDAEAHPGDKLLPNWYIKLISWTSTSNVFFSNSVADRFQHLKKSSILVHLFEIPTEENYCRQEDLILFVGRIKEYKGLTLLADAWKEIGETNLRLKVCGSGNGIPPFLKENAVILNRWLTDDEVTKLIGEAKVLVLPYVEASQSGLIPIAESLGTNIVVTPLAGLSEQLSSNTSHVISKNFTGKAIADAINIATLLPNIKSKDPSAAGEKMLVEFMK